MLKTQEVWIDDKFNIILRYPDIKRNYEFENIKHPYLIERTKEHYKLYHIERIDNHSIEFYMNPEDDFNHEHSINIRIDDSKSSITFMRKHPIPQQTTQIPYLQSKESMQSPQQKITSKAE